MDQDKLLDVQIYKTHKLIHIKFNNWNNLDNNKDFYFEINDKKKFIEFLKFLEEQIKINNN